GAEAVHHAHDDDQSGDAQCNRPDRKSRHHEDEPLALERHQVALGNHLLISVENHAVRRSSADSIETSSLLPVARYLSSTSPCANPRGPIPSCHGRPIRSIEPSLTPPRSSRSSYSTSTPAAVSLA